MKPIERGEHIDISEGTSEQNQVKADTIADFVITNNLLVSDAFAERLGFPKIEIEPVRDLSRHEVVQDLTATIAHIAPESQAPSLREFASSFGNMSTYVVSTQTSPEKLQCIVRLVAGDLHNQYLIRGEQADPEIEVHEVIPGYYHTRAATSTEVKDLTALLQQIYE